MEVPYVLEGATDLRQESRSLERGLVSIESDAPGARFMAHEWALDAVSSVVKRLSTLAAFPVAWARRANDAPKSVERSSPGGQAFGYPANKPATR